VHFAADFCFCQTFLLLMFLVFPWLRGRAAGPLDWRSAGAPHIRGPCRAGEAQLNLAVHLSQGPRKRSFARRVARLETRAVSRIEAEFGFVGRPFPPLQIGAHFGAWRRFEGNSFRTTQSIDGNNGLKGGAGVKSPYLKIPPAATGGVARGGGKLGDAHVPVEGPVATGAVEQHTVDLRLEISMPL